MNKDIERSLTEIRSNAPRYQRAERYYNGDHDLRFATEKFESTFGSLFREFALNLCPVICEAVRDKLRIERFSLDSGGYAGAARPGSRPAAIPKEIDRRLAAIWQRSRMGSRSAEVHKEALIYGDAYIFVWPDADGMAMMFPNRAEGVTAEYDGEHPGRITRAAKAWQARDKRFRLNLFYPDRTERYITRSGAEGALPEAKEFVPFGLDGPAVIPNPYGIVPVFHLANNAGLGQGGRSELEAAIPIQDGLNKSVLDMLVAMEFAAYRQRWAVGIEVEVDAAGKPVKPFTAGADHLWIAGDPQAKFGDFDAAALDQFLKVKDSFRADMASVTGTPLHYFIQQSVGYPSGESLRRAESRFIAKVLDRQAVFGEAWAEAAAFALRVEGCGNGLRLRTEWQDPAPLTEREVLENIALKRTFGLPDERALIEAGYGEADVTSMLANKKGEL